jgi:hypothetical protein
MRSNLNSRLDKVETMQSSTPQYQHMLMAAGRIDEIRAIAKQEHGIEIDSPGVCLIHLVAAYPTENGPDSADAVQGPAHVTVHF